MNGLTWNLSVVNNQLLAGRDDGSWKITGEQARQVSAVSGFWNYRPLPDTTKQIAAGYYSGIRLFRENKGDFMDEGAIKNFTESSRYIETDGNNLWISHPYRGVFKIKTSGGIVTKYDSKKGLPGDLDNHVFKIKNQIVFATTKGIYEYNASADSMMASKKYTGLFGQMPLRYLKEDEKGNIWFVQDKMLGVADFNSTKPAIHYIPELKNRILSGFENIYPYNIENILIGAESGFYHINYEKYRQTIRPFTAYITELKITGSKDTILYGGFGKSSREENARMKIPFKWNSLHFSYSTTFYNHPSGAEFSYYLEGFDKGWSNWGRSYEKEYTNLPEGTYSFHVKARNSPSHESEEYVYSFTISPPFYRTWWAYTLYALGSLFLLFSLYKFQERRHFKKQEQSRLADQHKFEEEQRQIAYQHQLEIEKSEKELMRLQNEKMAYEIKHKNTELASATMNLVQKKEFILKLKSELQQLQKNARVREDNPELKKLLKVLSEEEKLDEEWNSFSQHFNSVHGDFLTILKNKFPSLKPHELRLCAYLRLNLSSKEIAPLMSISIRGVEISRYRLRKKLALSTEINLVQYLMDLK